MTNLIQLFLSCLPISSNNKIRVISMYFQTSIRDDSISIYHSIRITDHIFRFPHMKLHYLSDDLKNHLKPIPHLFLFHSIYFVHHLLLYLSLKSFIPYIIYWSALYEIFIHFSDLNNLILNNFIYQVIVQYPSYHLI